VFLHFWFNACRRLSGAAVIKAMVDLAERLAVATFAGLLSVLSVGIFLWMAISQWKDSAGTAASVILMLMAGCQVVGSVVWFWRQRSVNGRRKCHNVDVDEHEL